jgi:hypothetical protein
VSRPAPTSLDSDWYATLEQQRKALLAHPLHSALTSPERLRAFCERHVYCVWDFMCLLKSLQRELTCVESFWTPPRYPQAARLINEIVLGEESDEIAPGRVLSHFAWYLEAMDELSADTKPIRTLTAAVAAGVSPYVALETTRVSEESRQFTLQTLRTLREPLETRLAVFFFARENLIPGLFLPLVEGLGREGLPCSTLVAYLRRHIEIDGGAHGPMARELLTSLVSQSPNGERAALSAASRALTARETLWDHVYTLCRSLP